MMKRSTIRYDNIITDNISTSDISADNLTVIGDVSILSNLDVEGTISGNTVIVNGFATDILISNVISTDTITATNVLVTQSIQYPVEIIVPLPDETPILLSSQNSGSIIDANALAQQYVLSLGSDLSVGDTWEIYINSVDPIMFRNNSGKTLQSAGIVYISNQYEYVPTVTISPNETIIDPGSKGKYNIAVTSVSDTEVRLTSTVILAT
jgi:hypothetical protein